MKRILIVQAHPDLKVRHYCHALEDAYSNAALSAGHHVDIITLSSLDIPMLRSKVEWESSDNLPEFIVDAQRLLEGCDHVVFIYPLWLGTMPALLKAWLEQVLRSDFAFNIVPGSKGWEARLGGQSARIVVTMGMPSSFYRLFYFAHSLRSFERNILKFCGIKPVRTNLIGMIDSKNPKRRENWLERMRTYGHKGI